MKTSNAAKTLSKLRWSRIPEEERRQHVPRNGGRPRVYAQCPRGPQHRFNVAGLCKCGMRKRRQENCFEENREATELEENQSSTGRQLVVLG